MKFNRIIVIGGLSAAMLSTAVHAGDTGMSHSHDTAPMTSETMQHGDMNSSEMNQDSMDMGQNKMFLEKKDIDGYTVSFHVMAAEEGMNHGGSHNLMIKVDQQGAAVKGVQMNSKVIYPDGTEESKPLMMMGDWQTAGYDLKDSGKHQLMVLFKTADGKKHFGGLYYGE